MRERHRRHDVGGIDVVHLRVYGIGIRVVLGVRTLGATVQVGACDVVDLDEPRFAARLDGHVRDGHALFHRHALDGAAGEFHGLVQRTVHADHTDDVQDDVFAHHARSKFALDVEQDRFGNLEPGLASRIAHARIGRTNAGSKRAERAIGAGVAVGTDDQIARPHNALLG